MKGLIYIIGCPHHWAVSQGEDSAEMESEMDTDSESDKRSNEKSKRGESFEQFKAKLAGMQVNFYDTMGLSALFVIVLLLS